MAVGGSSVDIINAAIEDSGIDEGVEEGGSGGTEVIHESGDVGVSEEVPATPERNAGIEDDPFSKEVGFSAKRSDGKENRIPYSRVKAIAEKRERTIIAQVAKELGITKAEAELKFEDIKAGLGERTTRLTQYETQKKEWDSAGDLLMKNPDEFIRRLAAVNPKGYARFAKLLEEGTATDTQVKQAVAAVEEELPGPDQEIEFNGQKVKTFSVEGLQKRTDAAVNRAVKQALADQNRNFDERFKPIEEERKATRHIQDSETALREKWTKALTWEGMEDAETQQEVLGAWKVSGDLHEAHRKIVFGRFNKRLSSQRDDILKEIKGAPAATSEKGKTEPPIKAEGPRTSRDIILEKTKHLN